MTTTTSVNVGSGKFYDVRDFSKYNKVQQRLQKWKEMLNRPKKEIIRKADQLQSLEKREYGVNVADVYRENDLKKWMNIELVLLTGFIFVTVMSLMAAINDQVYLIVVIFTGWFSSIVYRIYRHHVICYSNLLSLSANKCPYCGRSLLVNTSVSFNTH